MRPTLTLSWSRNGRRHRKRLDIGRIVIGRDEECSISFKDELTVSRKHAEIARLGQGWSLRDLGGKNHTYVNGNLTEYCCLNDGDRIQLGPRTEIRCEIQGGPDKTPLVVFERDTPARISDSIHMTNLEKRLRRDSSVPELARRSGDPDQIALGIDRRLTGDEYEIVDFVCLGDLEGLVGIGVGFDACCVGGHFLSLPYCLIKR